MRFSFYYDDINLLGKAMYINGENSFYYEPWNEVDFSILIGYGYNSLDVNLKTRRVLQLTGLNPRDNWIEKALIIPNAKSGCLLVSPNERYLAGTGVQYANSWKTYFDINTGWLCIGDSDFFLESKAVMFANNAVGIVDDNKLCSIWIKPYFV